MLRIWIVYYTSCTLWSNWVTTSGRLFGPVMVILAVSAFSMDTTNALLSSETKSKVAYLCSYPLIRTTDSCDISFKASLLGTQQRVMPSVGIEPATPHLRFLFCVSRD